jgi:predicted metal-dependent hydrolase
MHIRRKPRTPLTIVGTYQAEIDGRSIPYTLKRSAQARYVRFEIKQSSGLVVVIPKSYNQRRLSELLRKKSSWITRQMARYQDDGPDVPSKKLEIGDTVLFLGRELTLAADGPGDRYRQIRREQDTLIIPRVFQDARMMEALREWFRSEATAIIQRKADEFSNRSGLHFKKLSIREQRTRWGSCSRKGTLSFNWKLIMAPESVLDYVVIHEVAHLKEMNHSGKFWKLVASYCPDWKVHREWLKRNESWLRADPFPTV